jgi:two-component system sensor histidine kinase DegS
MPTLNNKQTPVQTRTSLDNLRSACRTEIDNFRRELKDLETTINHSQIEVNKLAQRNSATTGHLQQIQAQLEELSRQDVRNGYETVLDAQQRLFVMRGQLDKLLSDKAHLIRFISSLESIIGIVDEYIAQNTGRRGGGMSETVEMLIQTQEAERQRLARIMHDGPTQALANFILQTEIALRLFDKDQTKARDELNSLKNAASSTFQKVRSFIVDLRPMMLDDLGLVPTLNRYIESQKPLVNFDIRFHTSGVDQRLISYQEVMVFRAIQELLLNATNHSQASQVKIQVDSAAGDVRVSVEDNGRGFEPESISEGNGMGLKIIRDRVEMIGGEMDIDSVPGKGTRVSFSFPGQLVEKTES